MEKLSEAKQKLSHKLWITPCLLKSVKTRKRLCRAVVRSGFSSQKACAKYQINGNKVILLLEINKRKYHQSQCLSVRKDSGKMWKLNNSIISSKGKRLCLQEDCFDPIKSKLHKQSRSHVQYIQHLLCLDGTTISKQDFSPSPPCISSKKSFMLHDN